MRGVFMVNYKLKTKNDLVITSNDIRDIDKYTIGFRTEEEILKKHGLKGNLKISYFFREPKELEVAFADKKKLLDVEIKETKKINIQNKTFLEVFNEFLIKMRNPEFYNYFMSSTKVNDMVKHYVKAISTSHNDDPFLKNQLKSHLSSYLETIRLEDEKRIYDEQIRREEEEEEADRHQEEFYTEDDMKYYGEYMEMKKFPVSDMTKNTKWNR